LVPSPAGTDGIALEFGALTSLSATAPTGAPQVLSPEPDAHAVSGARPQAHDLSARQPSLTANAGSAQAPRSHPSVQRSPPTADARAGSTPRRPARGPLPFNLPRPLHAGGSSSSTGGSAPSLLPFGFATLIGFFVLAAPGLGRRIRPARLPSPRSRLQSPLDHPG
jgi:hypothetical protein